MGIISTSVLRFFGSLIRVVRPKAKQLYAERSAAKAPDADLTNIADNILDEALSRLGALENNHPWWKSALAELGRAAIQPDFFKKPHVMEWLSQTDVQCFLKQTAIARLLEKEVDSGVYKALVESLIAKSGEDHRYAESIISTAVAVLKASITGSVCDPGTAAITQAAMIELLGQLGSMNETLNTLMSSGLEKETNWAQHPDASYLALAILIGSWQDKGPYDIEVVTQLFGISYEEWLKKAREILHCSASPLTLKNGIWSVVNRAELCNQLGSRILDQNLDMFRTLAITVLKEPDPAFDLPVEERYAASIHGKQLKYSSTLRNGIAEGLAIMSSHPHVFTNCSQGKSEATCVLVIRELFAGSDWVLWGSLNRVLPILAETAPSEFLDAVEKSMRLSPCPFDELFSQESTGITGNNYLTGLLWALEGIAWDEQYLVRVCVVLGELASHDPDGQWANRPSNSLVTIFLPWRPQTLASIGKRKVAIQTLFNEWPEVAWKLIIQLLPDQCQTSFGTHKPKWRMVIPDDGGKGVTDQEYLEQSSFYAEFAVAAAGKDPARLSTMINIFGSLTKPAFDQLLQILVSPIITELPEEERLSIWDHLTRFTNKHRRFADAEWALPDELVIHIEKVAEQLAPKNPFNLYQRLFTERDFDLYEDNDDWEKQRKILDSRRDAAILEIFKQDGIVGVIRFCKSTSLSGNIGRALGDIEDDIIEKTLLPHFLETPDNKLKELVSNFIWRRYHRYGWEWCDNIDKSDWSPRQLGEFLVCLPFIEETWNRTYEWLQTHEGEYWSRTAANPFQADNYPATAIDKLIEYGRPHAAINCLSIMRYAKKEINIVQCVKALRDAVSSSEPHHDMDGYNIIELIKFLQQDLTVNQGDLFNIEWAYVSLLNHDRGAAPKLLENRLANNHDFFCELIRLIYASDKEEQICKETSGESNVIRNAFRLLSEWKTPPGTQQDGTFSKECFTDWLQSVKVSCSKSGHLDAALNHIGQVLVYTLPDPDGLWINRVVAAALNDRDADEMRIGFRKAKYNSRGAHWVDPTGKPERALAEQFRGKAEDIENAGFQRFAIILRELADDYEREAGWVISNHNGLI